MGQNFELNRLGLPEPNHLQGCNFSPLPYYLLGDEIFPLKDWLIRPYPGKSMTEEHQIYNYRHSRARRVIENTFGILTTRWRMFSTPIKASVSNTEKYVLACLALHNYLRQTNNAVYTPTGFVDSENAVGDIMPGAWRAGQTANSMDSALGELPKIRGSRYKDECIQMRDSLKTYLASDEGSVSWQTGYVRRTYKV